MSQSQSKYDVRADMKQFLTELKELMKRCHVSCIRGCYEGEGYSIYDRHIEITHSNNGFMDFRTLECQDALDQKAIDDMLKDL